MFVHREKIHDLLHYMALLMDTNFFKNAFFYTNREVAFTLNLFVFLPVC